MLYRKIEKEIRDHIENNLIDNLEAYDAPKHFRLTDVKIFEID